MATLQHMDTTYKPSGGLAGIYAGEEAADKRFANDMTLGQQALSLEKAANENPLDLIIKQRDSQFATQDMNPEMMAARQAGTIGRNQTDSATGFINIFTKDAKAQQGLAEAMAKTSEAQQQATVNGLETFIAKATSGGPTGMAMAMKDLDPSAQQLVKGLMQQGQDPVKFATQLRELLVKQMADNPKQRGAMDLQKLQDKGAMDRTRVTEAGQTSRADKRLAEDITTRKQNRNLEQQITDEMMQASRATDPAVKQMHMETVQKLTEIKKQFLTANAQAKAQAEADADARLFGRRSNSPVTQQPKPTIVITPEMLAK